MRASDDLPPPRSRRRARTSGRGRIIAIVVVVAAIVLLLSLRGLAGFYTDYLWFDSLDRNDVWSTVLGAKVALTLIFGGLFFVLLWLNLMIADRVAPAFRSAGPEEELLARYHDVVAGRHLLVRSVVSLLFAIVAGAGVSGQWEEWLLYVNRTDFGIDDPQFGRDIGFYVFELPFLSFVVSWAFASFVVILILTAVAHYLNGGIRLQTLGGERVTPNVKVHLSALLAVLAVIKAADYWLDRFGLTVSGRGVVDGALYTDVNAQLPALNLLILISLFAVVLLVVNLRRRGWVLPVLAVGLWAFVAIVVGSIYPAFVQRFNVEPNETSREAEFTERNIEATRAAFELTPGEHVERLAFDYTEELTPDQIRANAATVRNARLVDPLVVDPTFDRLQAEREFYRFPGVLDTDRYVIDGEITQAVLAARELNLTEVSSWERKHVRLTHGYALALVQANATTREGRPDFAIGGLPVTVSDDVDVTLDQPQIYHGEDFGGYALVGATVDEVDFVDSDTGEEVKYRYTGESGVEMGSFLRQAAFALRFGEIDPLISNFVTSDTRVIYVRDVRERVQKVAPFLELDADTYPVIIDGRVQYVTDAYTTTSRYPYSQSAENGRLSGGGLAGGSFNYVRNSVKAVVDAYDGDVTLYVTPGDDPIIEAWQKAFPDLFTDFDEMPDELRDHLRYPQDLFRVQTNMWASYQISAPTELIIGAARWSVAQDPGRTVVAGGSAEVSTDPETGLLITREARIDPYYSLMQLPGEDDVSFVSLRSFVPFDPDDDRRELEAFMVAEIDPDGSTRLVSYEVTGSQAPGPVLVASGISQTEEISERLTLLNNSGSEVQFGDLLLLPIDQSILWIRPLYVAAEGTSVPQLEFVIAAIGEGGENITIGVTLTDALENLFPGEDFSDILGDVVLEPELDPEDGEGDAQDDEGEGADPDDPTPDPGGPEELAEVLAEIEDEREKAREALAQDPPDYQAWADAQSRIDELLERANAIVLGAAVGTAGDDADDDAGGDGGDADPPTTTEPPEGVQPSDEEEGDEVAA